MRTVASVSPLSPRLQTLVQVPTPGDHYSPATGSAIITIIYQLARVHERHAGTTRVIVSGGTRHDHEIGRCVEVTPTRPPKKWQKAVDAITGRAGLPRFFGRRAYQPHLDAIPADFAGPILIHNNPVALPAFRRRFPGAMLCLWANNELWRTYADREVARIAATADRLICCSRYIADRTRARLPAAQQAKLRVVHNGVDTERFQPGRDAAEQPPVVLFLGRMIEQKGPHLLLQAASQIKDAVGPFRIRFVGSAGFTDRAALTPYERRLRALAEPLGERVEFVPFRDRAGVLEEYARASVFCVPSTWDDPCPLTVLEGLACGLATVASRRGGIPEEVGEAALLFDPEAPDALADHLKRLMNEPALREDYAARARRQAEQFAWERQYQTLLGALREAGDALAPA